MKRTWTEENHRQFFGKVQGWLINYPEKIRKKQNHNRNYRPIVDQTSKTVLIFIENCGFYGIKSEARVQVMKTPMKRHRESRRFQAILAQNSDRAFDVIHHWIGRFVKKKFQRLKEKRFFFPMVWFLVLSSKHNCLFDIAENSQVLTTTWF